jgi:chemotaxis protein MotB
MAEEQNCPKCEKGAPKWMVTFSDMVTLLLCFFILLLSFANTDTIKFKEVLGSMQDAFGVQREVLELGKEGGMELPIKLESSPTKDEIEKQRLVNLLKSAAGEEGFEKNTLFAIVKSGVKMEIMETAGQAMFKPGGTDLLDTSKRLLRKLIPTIKETVYKITIEGHTDDSKLRSGRYPSNWELSSARAGSVVRFFIRQGNLDPRRFKAVGLAETHPLVENDSPENRSKNRRVSVIFEVF